MHVIQRIRTDILVRHSHNHVKCSHKPRACEAAHRLHLLHLHMNSHSRIFAHTQRKQTASLVTTPLPMAVGYREAQEPLLLSPS